MYIYLKNQLKSVTKPKLHIYMCLNFMCVCVCIRFLFIFYVCSYNKQASQYTELREKYIHLSQLYETESKSKWQYLAQIEDLKNEVKTLREEVSQNNASSSATLSIVILSFFFIIFYYFI